MLKEEKMKKAVVVLLALGVCIAYSPDSSFAWFGAKKKATESEQPVVMKEEAPKAVEKKEMKKEEVKKVDKAKVESEKALKALVERKRNELNNTEWMLELTPLSGKGKKESELVVFTNNQISFSTLGKKGFPSTNYTLSVQPDGIVVWETMQTSDKGSVAFWRGEMDGMMQSVRGILSHQIDENTKEDFSFVSTGKKAVEPGK